VSARLRTLAKRLNDPATRTGTAFWAALGAGVWDVLRHGASWPSVALLAALAGLGVASALATGRSEGMAS
jgi:hypothetical protein